MPDKSGDSGPTFEEFKKEMDEFFVEFEKKLKALKLDPKVTDDTAKSFMPTQKQLLEWAKKNSKNQPIPLKKLPQAAKKTCRKLPWVHVSAAPGGAPDIPDGIKFNFGSKKISVGIKVKYDSKKERLKLEPVGTIKFSF